MTEGYVSSKAGSKGQPSSLLFSPQIFWRGDMLLCASQSWTSAAQGEKATPERAWGLGAGLLLEVACFQSIKMMKMAKWPRNDKASGMLPTTKTNSWALSPGALSHAFGLILWMRWRVAGDMFIRVRFLCFPVFTDRIGKTICGSHCQTLWDSRRETIYWLTFSFLSFYFHYLLLHAFFVCLFLVSCLKFFFWNDAVYK